MEKGSSCVVVVSNHNLKGTSPNTALNGFLCGTMNWGKDVEKDGLYLTHAGNILGTEALDLAATGNVNR
jgi:hypothetical protein